MKNKTFLKKIARAIGHYFTFFTLVALLVTCTLSLFVSIFARDTGLDLNGTNLNHAAKAAFLCVILLSLLFTVIDVLRRKLTTERITRHIAHATRELVQGNFDTRIAPVSKVATDHNFNDIIDCFNKIAEELGSVETLRTDFVANVSHEMKTPLAVMQNYGTLLQSPDLSEEKRLEYAKGITEASRRLANMMTNILKLNRLENQQIYPQVTEFDLGEQLCESLLQFENLWEREQIDIETDIAEAVTVQADRELLELVWNNLLSNAFKFTPQGGTVSLSLTADEHFAVVRVQDTGCGMSADIGQHIFEKFYQGDTSRATQGNGLGLALVKRVMDILHGEISVESTANVGSIFTVKIRRK